MSQPTKMASTWIIFCMFMHISLSSHAPQKLPLRGGNSSVSLAEDSGEQLHVDPHDHGLELFVINVEHVKTPFLVTSAVFLLLVFKVGFHHCTPIANVVPESCLLIVVGLLIGMLAFVFERKIEIVFTPSLFFLYLLPPIMLEAAFSLHDRAVFENLGTILLYAVVGTVVNTFSIGSTLYGLGQLGMYSASVVKDLTLTNTLLFAALISAVDPVAVLAIFQEIHVNPVLYFLVFGESLLNDAVTVVIYRTMSVFTEIPSITIIEISKGVLSFFIVSLGGVFMGLIYGILTAFFTRFTKNVTVVEPLAVLGLAYLAYVTAEIFEFSGIIAIITCGVMQAQYSFANISDDSQTTIVNFSRTLSSVSDCIIFLFLGLETVDDTHVYDFGFMGFTIVCCLLFRAFGVLTLTAIANRQRLRKVGYEEQFIMSYGGLRGAVGFSLAILIKPNASVSKDLRSLFLATTILVIFFTVFVQGITMKPFVRLLRIKTADVKFELTVNEEVNENLLDHILEGVEVILGQLGSNTFRSKLEKIDQKFIKPALQSSPEYKQGTIMKAYEEVMLR